jgi:2-polyprenyl-3-methyl-5-hydroxy-6-metoxy-1,4-benzoquinol methylase
MRFDFKAVFEPNDYLYFYSKGLTKQRTNREVDFLIKYLKFNKTMEILDLACGHGRHSNRLAELGYNVTGVDITKGFLDIAKEEAKQKKLNVKYILEDMRKIDFKEQFDRVLLMFTAIGYFNETENLQVLRNIARALKHNGLLCFETFNREAMLKTYLPYIVTEKGKDLQVDIHTYDKKTFRLYNKRIVIRDGKRKDKPFFVRLYSPEESAKLLLKAGLKIHKIYADFTGKRFTKNSRRMIVVAVKP